MFDDNSCSLCGNGFYVDGGRCRKCNATLNCSTCTNNTSCLTCQNGFYLDENKICVKCD